MEALRSGNSWFLNLKNRQVFLAQSVVEGQEI
jgi:hypothetical protein